MGLFNIFQPTHDNFVDCVSVRACVSAVCTFQRRPVLVCRPGVFASLTPSDRSPPPPPPLLLLAADGRTEDDNIPGL